MDEDTVALIIALTTRASLIMEDVNLVALQPQLRDQGIVAVLEEIGRAAANITALLSAGRTLADLERWAHGFHPR